MWYCVHFCFWVVVVMVVESILLIFLIILNSNHLHSVFRCIKNSKSLSIIVDQLGILYFVCDTVLFCLQLCLHLQICTLFQVQCMWIWKSTFTVNTSALFDSRIITDFLALWFLLKAVAGLCLLLELDAAWILICNMGGGGFSTPVKLCCHFYLFDITSFLIPFPALGMSYYFLLKFWPFCAFLFGTKFSRWILLVSLRGNWSKGASWVLSMGEKISKRKRKKGQQFFTVFISAPIS